MEGILGTIARALPEGWVRTLVWLVVLLAATSACARVVARLLRHVLRSDENPLPSSSIIVNIARGAVWALGGSVILDTCFAVNVSAFVAALGVGGIAISLGFQDTLSNLIGGLQLTFMRIVVPGDHIEVGADKGVVRDVGWRHTTIENAAGETIVIPNSVLSKTSLVRLPPATTVVVPFAVSSGTRPLDEDARAIAEAAVAAAEPVCHVVSEPKAKVLFTEITEYGFKGKVLMRVEDPALVAATVDAVVRAIAPLTR